MKPIITVHKTNNCPSLIFVCVSLISFVLSYFIAQSVSSLPWQFLDELGHQYVMSIRSETLTLIMKGLSWWGLWGVLSFWIVIVSRFMFAKKWRFAAWLFWIAFGGWTFAEGLKVLIGRPRPTADLLATEISRSMPSSHSLTSILLCLTLSYLCFHFSRRFLLSFLVFLCSMFLALAVGVSRIYLGIHFLSDVMSGFLLGIGFFACSLWFFKKI